MLSVLLLFCLCVLTSCNVIIRPYQSGDVLVADDFSESRHHWDIYKDADGSAVSYYQDGILILLNAEQTERITTLNNGFSDTRIEVTARKISGSDNNLYGIICRFADEQNYYGFLVTSDGYYMIYKVFEGAYESLSGENLLFSAHIRQADQPNQLEAECSGSSLALRANGFLLAEASDTSFSSGRPGLFAGTYQEKNTAVWFDNFVVSYP